MNIFKKCNPLCASAPIAKRRAAWGRTSSCLWDCFLVRRRVGSRGERRAGPQTLGSKAEQMCFQFPPPLLSSGRAGVFTHDLSAPLHSSKLLAAVLSHASSVRRPLSSRRGQENTAAIRRPIASRSSSTGVQTVKGSPSSVAWVDLQASPLFAGGGNENCPLILDKYVPLHVC